MKFPNPTALRVCVSVWRLPNSNKQFSDTSRVCCNSTEFWHCLQRNNIRFRLLGLSSTRLPLPLFRHQLEAQVITVLLTNWLWIRGSGDNAPPPLAPGLRDQSQVYVVTCISNQLTVNQSSHDPLLNFSQFARAAHRNQRNMLPTRLLIYYKRI